MSELENKTTSTEPNTHPEENGVQGRTFTQDEVNAIVSDRLKREREKLAQPSKVDEREQTLIEREKALAAREARNLCQDYLAEVNISEKYRADFMEALDVSDFDRFKAIVDRLGKPFMVKTVTIGAQTANPPTQYSSTEDSALAAAFQPKM